MAAHPEVLNYLVEGAKRRGIDPAVVVKAFGHEGLNVFDPNKPDLGGDEGSSFGPYQLHYKGMSKSMPNAGMGDDFTRATGLDARDPSTWRQQTDFVLDHLANGGNWSPWMGAAAEGIYGRTGLPGGTVAHAPSVTSPQAAIDAAGPGQKPQGGTTLPAPGSPGGAMGPANPPGWGGPATAIAASKPDETSPWGKLRKKLATAATGFKAPNVSKNDTTLASMAMPGASRVDTPEVAPFDQNQIAQQRQNLAMAMQRLNSGKIWL